jgi:hypothetical protein
MNFLKFCKSLIDCIQDELRKESYYKKLSKEFDFSISAISSSSDQSKTIKKFKQEFLPKAEEIKSNPFQDFFAIYLQYFDKLNKINLVLDLEYIPDEFKFIHKLLNSNDSQTLILEISKLDEDKRKIIEDLMLRKVLLDENVMPKVHIEKQILGLLRYRYTYESKLGANKELIEKLRKEIIRLQKK